MSWLQSLAETYDYCIKDPRFSEGVSPLQPLDHIKALANIEIIISGTGSFKASKVFEKPVSTTIPCTEASASARTGKYPIHHPLSDKIKYLVGDFRVWGGDDYSVLHEKFMKDLKLWAESASCSHPKLLAIYQYLLSGTLLTDLVTSKCIVTDKSNKLIFVWDSLAEGGKPPIFRSVSNICDSMIRWRVEEPGVLETGTWEDTSLALQWTKYVASREAVIGLCNVTGQVGSLAENHPKGILPGYENAKLISVNDKHGFTYRGRFSEAQMNCAVSAEISKKAHEALRWLIARQGYRDGSGYAVVSWRGTGAEEDQICLGTRDLFELFDQEPLNNVTSIRDGDVGQSFSEKLSRALRGYRATFGDTSTIHVLAVNAASPGRLAVVLYRMFEVSGYLERLHQWHLCHAWPDRAYGTGVRPLYVIAKSISQTNDKQQNNSEYRRVFEQLLPCIVDGTPVPRHLLTKALGRVQQPLAFERNSKSGARKDWETLLTITCGLYRGTYQLENYSMALENDRKSRSYLYGRLLALASHLEGSALRVANEEPRDTNAMRLMQRYAQRPYDTWRTLELALAPYRQRLQRHRIGLLVRLEKALDEVMCLFAADEFIDDSPLTGEFLLGFHCQRRAFFAHSPEEDPEQNTDEELISQ